MRLSSHIYILLILLFSSKIISQSCDVNGKKHFNYQDVKLILDKNKCNSCHKTSNNTLNWSYETYQDLTNTSNCNQTIIAHGSPNQSLLIDKLNGGPTSCGNAMPLGNSRISDSDLLALENWIEIGAPEHCLSDFDQIKTILSNNNCNSCHSSSGNWSFDTYSSLFVKPVTSVCNGQEIIKYDAKNSLLYQKISGKANCGAKMPSEGNPMSDLDIAKIRDWINAGAPISAKVLPVSLVDFRTEIDNLSQILLSWETASEENTSHFEVEFSRDGIHFSTVGDIKAEGNNQRGEKYNFLYDFTFIGFHYFRLKIIDYDNKFSYSPIRVQKIENDLEVFTFMPNPIFKNNDLNVEWYPIDDREKVKMHLVNITGQLKTEYIISAGINSLDLSGILSGIYYISIEDYYSNRIIKKLVILDY